MMCFSWSCWAGLGTVRCPRIAEGTITSGGTQDLPIYISVVPADYTFPRRACWLHCEEHTAGHSFGTTHRNARLTRAEISQTDSNHGSRVTVQSHSHKTPSTYSSLMTSHSSIQCSRHSNYQTLSELVR
ncbi:hypothetical protein BDW02DRAFT_560985 [Decorospora gaudefroyi]|uniref:Uncharacterized protein n=1 Tax=Decorospora gaudefroyi TaxID=184978 RepID=A0A6A5K4T9_9PLEO|nr:hypothetical protein BDW02DRAFT_560985 [Decorospora gaudefroyi]